LFFEAKVLRKVASKDTEKKIGRRNKQSGNKEISTRGFANMHTCQKVVIWKTYQNLKSDEETTLDSLSMEKEEIPSMHYQL